MRSRTPRRLIVAGAALGVFLLLDLALFGWLVFRTLSQREIERAVFETQTEAESLAGRIAASAAERGDDLYTAVVTERETRTYIDALLKQRDILQTIEVRDLDGRLVFQGGTEASFFPEGEEVASIEPGQSMPGLERQVTERQDTYDVEVPIGELGVINIGLSRDVLQQRIERLRGELVTRTAGVGALTLVLLVAAYALFVWAWRRSLRAEKQAAQAERLAYVGTLASGLAHEIRNPLNALSLNMQLLEEEAGEAPGGAGKRALLTTTREEIGRLERLVTDFLSYARPRPLQVADVEAVSLLERCRDLLAGELAARHAEVEVHDMTGGARLRVDPEQMGQLLINLVQNALAAADGGPPRIALRALREGPRVALEVADQGCGIAPEDRDRVFDLFYSTRKGGTGLGLAVVRRIAEAHDAVVDVESEPGRGTQVRISLPGEVAGA